jgi:hypothetical protein|nr:MAG TPA: hypothetical protein [Caudoviricetes sp.]
MDKSELFRRAHKMTKAAIAKFGGNYLVTFAQALKEVYKKATEVECFRIKSWFMAKNEDKFGDLNLDPNFAKRDIIKETAKAYQIRLQALTNVTVTKLVWVPKSCVEC